MIMLVQCFVPEEMLVTYAEDEEEMDLLIEKVYRVLEKEGALRREDDDGDEGEGKWTGVGEIIRSVHQTPSPTQPSTQMSGADINTCEMCERYMPLTKHHLIPRSTHKKYTKMGYTPEVLNTCASICRYERMA